ncbi:MAG: SRPBCC family protein [Luteolibacter sp.]
MNLTHLSIMSLLTLAPVIGKEPTTNHQMEVVKKPLRVETSSVLPFPAERVWKLIAGFDTLPDYHASITTSELLEGGAVRKIGLTEPAGGGHVVERLVYFNDATREFSYKITDLIDCRFPLRNYQAYVRLEAVDENSCRLHWGSVFTVEGATEKGGEDLAKIIYQGSYDGIRRVLGK